MSIFGNSYQVHELEQGMATTSVKLEYLPTGNTYKVLYKGLNKVDSGEWVDCLIYRDDYEIFVRRLSDFPESKWRLIL